MKAESDLQGPTRSGDELRKRWGLRGIVNASGRMSSLGAAIAHEEVVRAAAILTEAVEIDELQDLAGKTIAGMTGAEAGFVAASASAGISHGVAAAMTGGDLAAVESLPDVTGLRSEIVMPASHLVHYNAPISQAVRLTGATVQIVGQANRSTGYQLAAALGANTAGAIYVVSHYVRSGSAMDLDEFAKICHAANVPVIVDAAAEADLRIFIEAGADLVIYSAHKYFNGPTAGIVCGTRKLVDAAYLQNKGICRGMKIGKEGIAGTIAALRAWQTRDHRANFETERKRLEMWLKVVDGRPGVNARIIPNETNDFVERLEISFTGKTAVAVAQELASALAAGDPPVMIRGTRLSEGVLLLDPSNIHPGEELLIAERLAGELDRAGI